MDLSNLRQMCIRDSLYSMEDPKCRADGTKGEREDL